MERLGTSGKASALLRFTDRVQANEDVSGILEDLQEAIINYGVCSCPCQPRSR